MRNHVCVSINLSSTGCPLAAQSAVWKAKINFTIAPDIRPPNKAEINGNFNQRLTFIFLYDPVFRFRHCGGREKR